VESNFAAGGGDEGKKVNSCEIEARAIETKKRISLRLMLVVGSADTTSSRSQANLHANAHIGIKYIYNSRDKNISRDP
jgi:hypothetical protein